MTPLAQAPSRKGVWLFCMQGLSDRYPTFWVSGSTPCFTNQRVNPSDCGAQMLRLARPSSDVQRPCHARRSAGWGDLRGAHVEQAGAIDPVK